jgi:geranylgeranyl pyrophosphate synthase
MVAGQSIDLPVANKSQMLSRDGFETTRNLKTSALIRMALRVGAIFSNANETELNALSRFADLIGDAYQTSDDLLDLPKDATLAAEASRRETIALEKGINSAKERINNLITQAKKFRSKNSKNPNLQIFFARWWIILLKDSLNIADCRLPIANLILVLCFGFFLEG